MIKKKLSLLNELKINKSLIKLIATKFSDIEKHGFIYLTFCADRHAVKLSPSPTISPTA